MAGNWIKWLKGLTKRREVLVLARKLNMSPREAASACMETWEWADDETTDGHIQGATRDDLDRMLALPGFAVAFESPEVNWARFSERGITFTRWERNNGESAKKRSLESRKKRRQRELEDRKMSRSVGDKCPDKKPPRTSSSSSSHSFEIPEELRTELFSAAWAKWERHRAEIKHPLRPTQAEAQLKKLEKLGESRAIETIEHTIEKGWRGLFEPDQQKSETRPLGELLP